MSRRRSRHGSAVPFMKTIFLPLFVTLITIMVATPVYSDDANLGDLTGGAGEEADLDALLEEEQIPVTQAPSEEVPAPNPAIEPSEQVVEPASEDELLDELIEDPNDTTTVEPEPVPDPTAPASNDNVKVNVVEINENYFKLVLNQDTGSYAKTPTSEAKPGDLLELVISATNKSNEIVNDVEMVHNIPSGPVEFLKDTFTFDATKSLYRISRTGKTFFPPEAEIDAVDIRFLQWQIFSLAPGETIKLSYRIQISNQ